MHILANLLSGSMVRVVFDIVKTVPPTLIDKSRLGMVIEVNPTLQFPFHNPIGTVNRLNRFRLTQVDMSISLTSGARGNGEWVKYRCEGLDGDVTTDPLTIELGNRQSRHCVQVQTRTRLICVHFHKPNFGCRITFQAV